MNKLTIYTDVSYNPIKKDEMVLGLVILQKSKIIEVFRHKYPVRYKKGKFEVYALNKAIKYLKNHYKYDYLKIRMEDFCFISKLKDNPNKLKDFRIFIGTPGEIKWVKAHNGNPYNTLADKLCNYKAKQSPETILKCWYKYQRFKKFVIINHFTKSITVKF